MEKLLSHLGQVDPLYWILVVLCSFIYALWNGTKNYKIDKANPNTSTTIGQWKAIGQYYASPSVVQANILTFLMSITLTLVVTLNQSEHLKNVKDGEFNGTSAALLASLTIMGSAFMLSYLTGMAKIKDLKTQTPEDDKP